MKNILIIKPSSLGDIVHTFPLVYAIKSAYPAVRVTWLVKREWVDVPWLSPYVDEVIAVSFSAFSLMKIVTEIRKRKFDAVIDVQGLLRSGMITLLSGSPVRIGFADARELAPFCYNRKIFSEKRHAVEKNLELATGVDCKAEITDFTVKVPEKVQKEAGEKLHKAGINIASPFIAINPNARWNSKRWDAEQFKRLIGLLINNKFSIIIVGAPKEREYCEQLIPKGADGGDRVINTAGMFTIPELCAILSKASLFITNDSGPMHLAACLGTPLIAIFGPTDPEKTGPYSSRAKVIRVPLKCAPCRNKECPLDMACMKNIQADTVYNECLEILNNKGVI